MAFLYILLVLIIITGLLGIYYLTNMASLKRPLYRVLEADKLINEVLQKKLDLILRAKGIIKTNTNLDVDQFREMEDLKVHKVKNTKLDRKLASAYKTIIQIKNDYNELKENRGLTEIIKEIKSADEKLEATKTFYNQYAKKLELKKSSFPKKIIAKLIKIKNYSLFNTKKTNDELINIDNL